MNNLILLGDKLKCIESNDYGFTVGNIYKVLDSGVDCYCNNEIVLKSENGKEYFVYAVLKYFKIVK
jgi:hypothetical protein